MDKHLIKSWAETIKQDDVIINLGDVFFKDWSRERAENLIKRMLGYKILILGNHDESRSVSWWKEVGFDEVSKVPILFDKKYKLSHKPMICGKNEYNIFGHLHSTEMNSKYGTCVSVECVGYKPILLNSVSPEE